MKKYHINRKGNPEECRASLKECPLGGEHYPNIEQALTGLEKEYGGSFAHSSLTKYKLKKEKLIPQIVETVQYLHNGEIIPPVYDTHGNLLKTPVQAEDYYTGLNQRIFQQEYETTREHYSKRGSQFTPHVKNLNDLLYQTLQKRKNGLKGDDKEEMIKLGASAHSFKKNYSYILSPIGGKEGITHSTRLPSNTPLTYYANPPKSNHISFTAKMKEKPDVPYSTLVFKNTNQGKILYDAYPGLTKLTDSFTQKLPEKVKHELEKKEKELIEEMSTRGILTIGNLTRVRENLRGTPTPFNVEIILI